MSVFAGKVMLITGAGRGAGRDLARALAARGALIAANDITPINVEALVGEINAAGGQAGAYIHDIAKKVAAQALVNQVSADFGRLDVLLNCANVQPSAALLDLDEWDLHRTFEVNAIGAFLMTQIAGRVMRQAGGGVILHLLKLPPEAPASYLASRSGLLAFSQRADRELDPYGIRVLAVSASDPVEAALRELQSVLEDDNLKAS